MTKPVAKVRINKSRSGHYTVTVGDRGWNRVKVSKLGSLNQAREAVPAAVAAFNAQYACPFGQTYATEFPAWADDAECAHMAAREGWEDSSWHNDTCPSFTCDVFVLFIDHADRASREFPEAPRFSLTDEGRTVLETDSWADVLAFMDDGKRDFPEYEYDVPYAPEEDAALKAAWDAA